MSKTDDILRRIERVATVPNLAGVLAEKLEPSDLHSLLLAVFRQRAKQRDPVSILSDYSSNALVRPSSIDPRLFHNWEKALFAALPPQFIPIELSPLCPFGTSSGLAQVSQDKTLVTTRGLEVLSDATNVLALECAIRRRQATKLKPKTPEPVKLAASHRLVRPHSKAYPHFRLFNLVTAARDLGGSKFESENCRQHLAVFLHSLESFIGTVLGLRLSLTDLASDNPRELWMADLSNPLKASFPTVDIRFDQSRESGRGYYRELCFKLHATDATGNVLEIGDGGAVDWTQQMLSDAKERLFISAIASDRVCSLVPC